MMAPGNPHSRGLGRTRRENSSFAMTSETSKTPPGQIGKDGRNKDPDWANGLKRLYDSVVEEPLPDTFQDLLDKLDSKD